MKRKALILQAAAMAACVLFCSLAIAAPPPENPAASATPTATVSFVGNIMFDRGVAKTIEAKGAAYVFTGVASEIKKADLAVGNLECPLIDTVILVKDKETFSCNPVMAVALSGAGFDAMFLPNKHILDQDRYGMMDTVDYLYNAGIVGMGVAINPQEAQKASFSEVKGIKLAFVSFSETPPVSKVYLTQPGPFGAVDGLIVRNAVAAAKKKADVVIAMFSWGEDYGFTPTETQKGLARVAVAAGASLVVGFNPHVLQPYEMKDKSFIAYSLGNFIYDDRRTAGSESAIMTASFDKQGLVNVEFQPVVIVDGRPAPVMGEKAVNILKILAGERKFSIYD
ncbi:MAG: CapA family protein [bacterium]